jgi:hypothetical protein
MSRDRHIQALMATLLEAIRASLAAREAAHALVAELLKGGTETASVFSNNEPALTLTAEDREFLRALSIRVEDR